MKPATIKQYFANFDTLQQSLLQQIHDMVHSEISGGEDCISYSIACIRKGRMRFYYAAFKDHISVYPAPRNHTDFVELLKPFKGGKELFSFHLTSHCLIKLFFVSRGISYQTN